MTRKLLESYRSNKRIIERYSQKIADEKMTEVPCVRGKVKGSSPDFPYIEQRFSVDMDDPVEAEKQYVRIRKYRVGMEQAQKDIDEVDRFIETIEDAKDREILMYRYVDGLSATTTGKKVGYTHGRVSQITSKYLKD